MKVYITDHNNIDQYIKIFKKKISYENIIHFYQRSAAAETKKSRKETKRIRKHAFRKHIAHLK